MKCALLLWRSWGVDSGIVVFAESAELLESALILPVLAVISARARRIMPSCQSSGIGIESQ